MIQLNILGSQNRVYGLDILRAFAILNVVYEHGYRVLDKTKLGFESYNMLVFDGVATFFVLSGYLIGTILINLFEQPEVTGKDVFNFWIRRWCRTIPNYFLILSVLGGIFYFSHMIKLSVVLKYYIFSQNLYYPITWFFPESWSLSVEEWFYIIVPLLMYCLARFLNLGARKTILLSAVIIIVASTIYRYFHINEFELSFRYWDLNLRKVVAARLDSIMYGVLIAFGLKYYKSWWETYKVHFLVLGILILLVSKYIGFSENGLYNNVFSFPMVSIGTALLIPYLSALKAGKGFIWRSLTFISIISYSMYLINLVLVQDILLPATFDLLNITVDVNNTAFILGRYTLFLFYTIFLSYVIFVFYEKPTTALRERFMIK